MTSLQSIEEYFSTTPEPTAIEEAFDRVSRLLSNLPADQKVVFVTSGGTTVPLEKNTVRFIDNFSTGVHGATAAEHFLDLGYHVVFFNRPTSAQPFLHRLLRSPESLLDSLSLTGDAQATISLPQLSATDSSILSKYASVKDRLHKISFTSVSDYLFGFRRILQLSGGANGRRSMVFCCAAVSDFFIPESAMSTHKIDSQGGQGGLDLKLWNVPKMLHLVRQLAPNCFFVAFKLDTTVERVLEKAAKSVATYRPDVVVGNELHTRREKIFLIDSHTDASKGSEGLETVQVEPGEGEVLERELVERLVKRHDKKIRCWLSGVNI